jgi:serine/threonine protein kinase
LRPIDFEGAWRIDQPNAPRWASQSFAAPEVNSSTYTPRPSQDLYSLGVILYYLLWGSLPSGDTGSQPKQRRRNSVKLLAIVSELLSSDPEKRPYASAVMDRLVRI